MILKNRRKEIYSQVSKRVLGKPDLTNKQNLLRIFSHAVQPRNKSHPQSSNMTFWKSYNLANWAMACPKCLIEVHKAPYFDVQLHEFMKSLHAQFQFNLF